MQLASVGVARLVLASRLVGMASGPRAGLSTRPLCGALSSRRLLMAVSIGLGAAARRRRCAGVRWCYLVGIALFAVVLVINGLWSLRSIKSGEDHDFDIRTGSYKRRYGFWLIVPMPGCSRRERDSCGSAAHR